MKNYVLAHDLGTTGNKATLYDRDGRLVASAFHEYGTTFDHTGWAEQNPNDWWNAVCISTHQLLDKAGIHGSEIACVTFSGQMMAAVPLDSRGHALRPAIIWMDQRATAQADHVGERLGRDEIYRITGHRLSAAYSLSKITWIKQHQPQIYADTHKFVLAKDAMIARMTGQFATEPSDASGMNLFDLNTGTWSASIIDAAELDASKLPDVHASTDVIGEVLPAVAEELGIPAGTPVVMGGGDGSCAAVGAGSVEEGTLYCYVGSSSWIATTSKAPLIDTAQRTFTFGHVLPCMFMPTGTMQTAGASYQWTRDQLAPLEKQFADSLGVSAYELMNTVAENSPAGANRLLFLPYLAGERSPRWNPDARAAFFGLTIRHTRADMLRSVMEGVAFNLRTILHALGGQVGSTGSIRVIGGGASSKLWSQILADVWGVPLDRLAMLEEATSMGAAVLGGIAVGLYPDASIARRMNPIAETIYPNPAHRAIYDELYDAFEALYTAVEPVYARLREKP